MKPDFNKNADGLIPAIIQDAETGRILMLGYMNEAAYYKTQEQKRVTFYSRSKQRLWTKGETSGNYLEVCAMYTDCDNDCLLVKVNPAGPVCHTGNDTCFAAENETADFIPQLEKIIAGRRKITGGKNSYITSLFEKGINKIAQKVGEEAVELVIEAKDNNDELFKNEAADLLFHYLILLQSRGFRLKDIEMVLRERNTAGK